MGSLVQFECWFYFCAFSNKTLHWEKKNKSWFHLLYEDNFMVHVVSFSTVSLLLKRFVMRVMWLKKQFSQNTPYSEMSLFLYWIWLQRWKQYQYFTIFWYAISGHIAFRHWSQYSDCLKCLFLWAQHGCWYCFLIAYLQN